MKKAVIILLGLACLFLLTKTSFAQGKFTILYTGETHASLYHCDCPIEPDGGLSRRAAKISQIRKIEPNLLVLDSGGFFASGVLDEHSQNTESDKLRTRINLEAMDLMGYDAVAVGDEEFNFGKEFLAEEISKSKIQFLSSNITFNKVLPFSIKEINGIKTGIIGLTPMEAKNKAGVEVLEPQTALEKTMSSLKQKGASLVVVLSHLGEEEDLKIVSKVKGIHILISGHRLSGKAPYQKIDSTLIVYPSWQGRRLGRLDFIFDQGKIIEANVQQIRLSDQIPDDPSVSSILPECFSDKDCQDKSTKGAVAKCVNPGTRNAKCHFEKPQQITLTVISPAKCRTCNTADVIAELKSNFAALKLSTLDANSSRAKKIIAEYKIKMLPAYLLSKDVARTDAFTSLTKALQEQKEHYMLSPSFSGVSYFVGRPKVPGRLDLFISTQDKEGLKILEPLKRVLGQAKINFQIHFLAIEDKETATIKAIGGVADLEEAKRIVCMMNYYPKDWWDYLLCRAKNAESTWWDECLEALKVDAALIKRCAKTETGTELLRKNIQLTEDLEISRTPIFLLDNQEVFGLIGAEGAEEKLKEIILKKK